MRERGRGLAGVGSVGPRLSSACAAALSALRRRPPLSPRSLLNRLVCCTRLFSLPLSLSPPLSLTCGCSCLRDSCVGPAPGPAEIRESVFRQVGSLFRQVGSLFDRVSYLAIQRPAPGAAASCVGPAPPPPAAAGPQQLAAALVICAATSTGIASSGAGGAAPPPPPAATPPPAAVEVSIEPVMINIRIEPVEGITCAGAGSAI